MIITKEEFLHFNRQRELIRELCGMFGCTQYQLIFEIDKMIRDLNRAELQLEKFQGKPMRLKPRRKVEEEDADDAELGRNDHQTQPL